MTIVDNFGFKKTVQQWAPKILAHIVAEEIDKQVLSSRTIYPELKCWFRFRDDTYRDLMILGRQRDGDGQNKLLQINGSKDNSSYIINRMNLI